MYSFLVSADLFSFLIIQFFLCPLLGTNGKVAYYLGVQTEVKVLQEKQDGEILISLQINMKSTNSILLITRFICLWAHQFTPSHARYDCDKKESCYLACHDSNDGIKISQALNEDKLLLICKKNLKSPRFEPRMANIHVALDEGEK